MDMLRFLKKKKKILELLSFALVILGLLQIIGFITGSTQIKLLGEALVTSPLPRPFVSIDGYENIGLNISFEITAVNGSKYLKNMDRIYLSKLEGPHKRKIVYINSITRAPRLTRSLYISPIKYGFCNKGPLSKLFGQETDIRRVVIFIAPNDMRQYTIKMEC